MSTSRTAAAAGQKTCTASGAGRLRWREPWAPQPPAAIAQDYEDQAKEIVADLAVKGIVADKNSELIALIAYMRCLGANTVEVKPATR